MIKHCFPHQLHWAKCTRKQINFLKNDSIAPMSGLATEGTTVIWTIHKLSKCGGETIHKRNWEAQCFSKGNDSDLPMPGKKTAAGKAMEKGSSSHTIIREGRLFKDLESWMYHDYLNKTPTIWAEGLLWFYPHGKAKHHECTEVLKYLKVWLTCYVFKGQESKALPHTTKELATLELAKIISLVF